MKRRDLEKHLRGQGAEITRDRGNHTVRARGDQSAPVPRHREIAPALVRAICKQLGILRHTTRGSAVFHGDEALERAAIALGG